MRRVPQRAELNRRAVAEAPRTPLRHERSARTRASPEVSRPHVDRTLDPQIGNVDVPRLAPERIARLWPATVLRFIASAMRQWEDLFALSDRAEQAGDVDEVLGNHVNDLTLSLHLAATPDHVCRENETALPLEQGRPNDEVRDVRLVFERDKQNAIG
jgi:hypothetical protein